MEHRIQLDGVWKYRPDPDGTMLFHTIVEDFVWKQMVLPQNWYQGGVDMHGGVVWFRRTFRVPAEAIGRELLLTFTGVDYHCTVWVNQAKVGEHTGYFQTFTFNVTPHIRTGQENIVTVRVDSPYEEPHTVWPAKKQAIKGVFGHHDARPGGGSMEHGQEKNTGGIWNSVFIALKDKLRLEQVRVSPVLLPSGQALLDIRCTVRNDTGYPQSAEVRVAIGGHNFELPEPLVLTRPVTLAPACQVVRLVCTIPEPRLWWCWDQGPQDLYQLKAAVVLDGRVTDEMDRRFGIRQIEISPQQEWLLNGVKVFVRGSNIIPTQWLGEYTAAMITRDIRLAKEAHLNALRVHAHVNRAEFYNACDEAGLLVWQDFTLQWEYEESDAFREEATRQLEEMIDQLHHHPGIAVWCCHNEPGSQADTLDRLLYRTAVAADPTRPVRASSTFAEHPYPGWYGGNMVEFGNLPGAPFPTEFGAQALPCREALEKMLPPTAMWPPRWDAWEYHNFQYFQTFHTAKIELGNSLDEFVRNSQHYQYNLIKFAIENYRCARFKPMNGFFHFMFIDPWPAITWSVLDHERRPKPGYRALQLACQPVLVRLHVPQREFLCGAAEPRAWQVTIVNDLRTTYADAALKLWLADPQGQEVAADVLHLTVAADGMQTVQAEHLQIPVACLPGEYRLRARLITAQGALLSENEEAIHVMQKT
jgi:beta-mannosidase